MNAKTMVSVLLAVVGAASVASVASAQTMQGRYAGPVVGSSGSVNMRVFRSDGSINDFGFAAGALGHRYWRAPGSDAANNAIMDRFTGGVNAASNTNNVPSAAQLVYTFCMDNRTVSDANQIYTLREITEAPVGPNGNPRNPAGGTATYSADNARRLNAIMVAAFNLGVVDNRGFFRNTDVSGFTAGQLGGAMQLLVWDSVWDATASGANTAAVVWNLGQANNTNNFFGSRNGTALTATAATGGGTIAAAVDFIRNAAITIFNDANSPIMARSITTNIGDQGQDQVVLIPLPPAAWAGIGTLVGAFGLFQIRRRSLTAQPA